MEQKRKSDGKVVTAGFAGGILFYFCLRFCQGVLPQAVPGVFCSKFAKGFAKGF